MNLDTMGWVVGLLLFVLLSAKEMVRAYGSPRTGAWMRGFNLALLPLLFLVAVAVVARILPLVVQP